MIAAAPLPICALQVCCHNNETCPARYYPARNAQAPRWIRAARARVGPARASPLLKMHCELCLCLQRRVRVRRSPRRTEAPREGGASRLTLSDPALHRDTLSIAAELPTQHLLRAAPDATGALRLHSAPQRCREDAIAALQPCRGITEATASAACPFFANKAPTTS